MKLTQVRAKEIVAQARDKAVHGPWCDQLDKVMSAEERDQVLFHWDTLDGSTNFVNALYDFVEGKVDKEYFYPTPVEGASLIVPSLRKVKLIAPYEWNEQDIIPSGREKYCSTIYIDSERYNVWLNEENGDHYIAQKVKS